MRKRRVIIFEDEPVVLLVFRHLFEMRDYELMAFVEPVVCPIYGDDDRQALCDKGSPCADVLITDNRMPKMSGIELLEEQARRGCKLPSRNKGLLSGVLEAELVERVKRLGSTAFPKPLEFEVFTRWLEECEERMDLAQPLAIKRREARRPCREKVMFQADGTQVLLTGLVVNTSMTGLCLQVAAPLEPGGTIRLLSALPIASPLASVRWTSRAENGDHLCGLQCR